MVKQLFISHSYKDISLANFIIHLLSYYQIDAWTSFIDHELGEKLQQNLDRTLLSCDNLLVLITKNTLTSSSVTSEILIFKKVNPYADIIPLVFDRKVELDRIAPGLGRFQTIDFCHDMTSGYRSLFANYGIEFLNHSERRQGLDRRRGEDRRKKNDRRSQNITTRLQRTFLDSYLAKNIVRDENDIDLNNEVELRLFFESIKQGAKNYLCYDEIGNLYNTNFVTDLCLNQALAAIAENSDYNNSRYIHPKYLSFAVAKIMAEKFIVKCQDRRRHSDRRSGEDRREIGKTEDSIWSLN